MNLGLYVNHIGLLGGGGELCLVDDNLLDHLNDVAHCPEQNQSAWRVVEQEEENQGQAVSHKLHLARALRALERSAHLRDFSIEQLRHQIDYRQNADVVSHKRNERLKLVDAVAVAKVVNPALDKAGSAELKVVVEQVVHREQAEHLENHRKAAAHRIVAGGLVNLGCLGLHHLRVVLVLVLDRRKLWLHFLHLERSKRRLHRKREQGDLKDDCHQDDASR